MLNKLIGVGSFSLLFLWVTVTWPVAGLFKV